jgi:hypothetical protein
MKLVRWFAADPSLTFSRDDIAAALLFVGFIALVWLGLAVAA